MFLKIFRLSARCLILRFFRTISFLCFLLVSISGWGAKRLLFIGISGYAPKSGWPELHSANDLLLLRQQFQNQGFIITPVLDQEATRAGINDKFNSFFSGVQPGDKVVLFFAGHGQQIKDDNGDEKDSLDEALVLYDSPKTANGAIYNGNKHLRDDELGHWVKSIMNKVGVEGHVFVLLDCCHSATGLRSGSTTQVRGGASPIVSPGFIENNNELDPGSGYFEIPASRGRGNMATVVLIAAAKARQQNHEIVGEDGKHYGSLSYAFAEALENIQAKETYIEFFTKIRNTIARHTTGLGQEPALEGEGGATVLGGDFIAKRNVYDLIKDSYNKASNTIRVSCGYLMGLFENTIVELVKKGDNSNQVLARGVIVRGGNMSSEVKLDRDLKYKIEDLVIVEKERGFGNKEASIFIDGSMDEEIRSGVTEKIIRKNAFKVSSERQGAELLLKREGDYIKILRMVNQSVVDSINIHQNNASLWCVERITYHLLAKSLRDTEINNSIYKARIGFAESFDDYGNKVVYEGKNTLIIKNIGKAPFYGNLIDIPQNDSVEVILPYPGFKFFLEPDKEIKVSVDVSGNMGTEIFKLVMTDKELILNPHPTRGSNNPLDKLMQRNMRGGENIGSLPIDKLAISTYTFYLKPKPVK